MTDTLIATSSVSGSHHSLLRSDRNIFFLLMIYSRTVNWDLMYETFLARSQDFALRSNLLWRHVCGNPLHIHVNYGVKASKRDISKPFCLYLWNPVPLQYFNRPLIKSFVARVNDFLKASLKLGMFHLSAFKKSTFSWIKCIENDALTYQKWHFKMSD